MYVRGQILATYASFTNSHILLPQEYGKPQKLAKSRGGANKIRGQFWPLTNSDQNPEFVRDHIWPLTNARDIDRDGLVLSYDTMHDYMLTKSKAVSVHQNSAEKHLAEISLD